MPDKLIQSQKAAAADLIAARASGSKTAEQAALNKMVKINKQQRAASDKAVGQVIAVEGAVKSVKSAASSIASMGTGVLLVAGLVAAWALFKK